MSIAFLVVGISSGLGSSCQAVACTNGWSLFGSSRHFEGLPQESFNFFVADPSEPSYFTTPQCTSFFASEVDLHVILVATGNLDYTSAFDPNIFSSITNALEAHLYPVISTFQAVAQQAQQQKNRNFLIICINSSIIKDDDFVPDCCSYQVAKSALYGLCESAKQDNWNIPNLFIEELYPGNYKTNIWPKDFGIPEDARDPMEFSLEVAQLVDSYIEKIKKFKNED
ncbi:hypothetical protein RCL1_008419 [Eukaryota sp. TZLM3-RCL]